MIASRWPVRLGVLGTGAVSQIVHMPILTDRPDVEVVAVSDTDRAQGPRHREPLRRRSSGYRRGATPG